MSRTRTAIALILCTLIFSGCRFLEKLDDDYHVIVEAVQPIVDVLSDKIEVEDGDDVVESD